MAVGRRSSTSPLREARARRDRAAAAPEPRRDDARRAGALRPVVGVDGDHAGDDRRAALGARRPALGLAGQAAGRAASRRCAWQASCAIPFTSGILIGIGETREERLDALRAIARRRGPHLQEVIVQNFRAKPGTRMADAPEPPLDDHPLDVAAARLLLPPGSRPGAAEPRPTTSRGSSTPGSTTGAASRR